MRRVLLFSYALIFVMAAGAASCEFSIRNDRDKNIPAEKVDTNILQKAGVTTPQDLYSDFLDMIDDVESMNSTEIDSLSDEDVLELGAPVRIATSNTIYFDDETLEQLPESLQRLDKNFSSLTDNEHSILSRRIENLLNSSAESADGPRRKSAQEIREILKNWASDTDESSACRDLFNQQGNFVLIGTGESFSIANYTCPAGSKFIVRGGVHTGQSVLTSKTGNSWMGLSGAVMDGQDSIYRAFSGGINQNRIGWIEMRNYHLHGIFSTSGISAVTIRKGRFLNIAPDSSGQNYGAIQLDNASDIRIRESYFKNVASAVRLRFSDGPLEVVDNEGLNTGRNFFQCDECTGSGIRISENTMIRTDPYGADPLEDWINIYKSAGDSTDWIQVHRNRARGHSLSGSGSFIMLGDGGGRFQEAVSNIGINPGQVGIGIAGGHHIKVEANKMYSTAWDSSNVAFYSANYSPGNCAIHIFPGANSSTPNRANWICGDQYNCHPPAMNHAWSDGQCGVTNSQITDSVVVDRSLNPVNLWNEWE